MIVKELQTILAFLLMVGGAVWGGGVAWTKVQDGLETNKEVVAEVKEDVKGVKSEVKANLIDINELDAVSREQAIMHQMTMDKLEQHGRIMEKLYDKLEKH